MIPKVNIPVKFLTNALLLGAFATHGVATAATCKGMSKSDCSAQSSCTWVGGYERTDGVKVNGYCRIKKAEKSSEKQGKEVAKTENKVKDKLKKEKSSKEAKK
mgnify:CR=1 FL=1